MAHSTAARRDRPSETIGTSQLAAGGRWARDRSVLRRTTMALAGAIVALGAAGGPARAQSVYVTGATQEGAQLFGTMNLATGTFRQIGPALPVGVQGLAPGPNGSLLTLAFSGDLLAIDPTTGLTSVIGPTGLANCLTPESPCGPTATGPLTASGGTVYATDISNNLYTVDPLTGRATLLGQNGIPAVPFPLVGFPTPEGTLPIFDEAFFPAAGQLYATFDAALFDFATRNFTVAIPPNLYRIDPATGRATLVAPTDLNLNAAVVVNGTTYAFNDGTGQIVTLDLTTGRTGVVSTFSPQADFIVVGAALAPAVVPEPATVTLIAVGVVGIVGGGWRRRRPSARSRAGRWPDPACPGR